MKKQSVIESAWDAWRSSLTPRTTIESMKAEGWRPRSELAKEVGIGAEKLTPAWGEKRGLETTLARVGCGGSVATVRFFRPKTISPV